MNKRIMAAALISIALMLTSCSAAANDNTPERVAGGQTKVTAINKSNDAKSPDETVKGFYITYNGVNIALDAETAPVVKAIGGNPVYTEKPSCAYVGIDYTYDYKAFILYAQSIRS